MGLYLQLAEYNAEGAAAVIADGLATRREAVSAMVRAVGGSVVGYYGVANGDWHVAAIVEFPDTLSNADLGRIELMQTATGRVRRMTLLPLVSPEAFDAASRAAEQAYQRPDVRDERAPRR